MTMKPFERNGLAGFRDAVAEFRELMAKPAVIDDPERRAALSKGLVLTYLNSGFTDDEHQTASGHLMSSLNELQMRGRLMDGRKAK